MVSYIFKLFFFVPYLIPILFAFIVGFDRPATFVADSDLSLIDQALRFNSDARHLNVDHPSLTSVIVLGWWLKFTKFIGLTNVDTLQELFDHKNPIETLQSLVLYTRMLSLTIIEIYILVFFNFLRALQLDKCTIILSLILIASGEGILSQS